MTEREDKTERIGSPALGRGVDRRHLRAGFIPLVDASVLIAAAEMGFAGAEGLTLDLVRDVSWANVRDRLAFRQFDIAHMLSPMPVAAMLGLGSNPSPTIAPFSLGRGGNAITLSLRLYERMQALTGLEDGAGALDCARALNALLIEMRKRDETPPTLGMTYPFSSHNYEFRYWLAAGGIDPDRDVRLVVVPPPLTPDALASGAIDGFCVGAPWNMIASERGIGRIVATKQDIWPDAPEKVVGMRPQWAESNRETVQALLLALDAAARWCDQPENRKTLAALLATDRYIDAPEDIILRVLSGEFAVDAKGNTRVIENYFTFHARGANRPVPRQALWIYSQMIRWGQTTYSAAAAEAAAHAFRPDLYEAALGPAGADESEGEATFMDGRTFDSADIAAYVEAFNVRAILPKAAASALQSSKDFEQ
ncbi:ABC transporter substrate-binding protein [Allorhizobium sp. BGMRC 0089]|uniref:CmpA/NrtA family ABC transporter substrate-binding protein n=1 Tax=Allorhizobium sonneratiae TaxID=2934936 RepID=UPI0020347975|nr:CmpA/NrtA family ABC transporter substrate-binding protein [Allorhizobium sonneratiae]MCM2294049.1 ABC transporter substrate-binding protein [Allorhizobium sonneratiae]